MAAALSAALLFDYFFIPPFHTFTVGSLEGWLVLGIFMAVAGVVVGRIQAILVRAQSSEREAVLMYELSTILAQASSQEAVLNGVARFLQQRYLASLVTIAIHPKGEADEAAAYEPQDGVVKGDPDRVLALLNSWGLVGEIQIWRGDIELPAEDSRLFQNFASQVGHVLERTYSKANQ
jgi:two-component system sensor histidine kinase KdpD